MASSNNSNARGNQGKSKFAPTQWITVSLTQEDRERMEDLYTNHTAVLDWLCDAVSVGFKFSCRYDEQNNTCVASLSRSQGGKNQVLTGRGSDAFAATLSCLYRHVVLLECDWESWTDAKTDSLFD